MLKRFVDRRIQLLLERMDLFPEEFGRGKKWDAIINEGVYTPVERFLIKRKVIRILREHTRNSIVEKITR
ncbi:MAG: hypothetical protein EBR82_30490 [Caulobacteraceae bacterium]|nr:hypothetical protein [Caulobacteraceae bacterium]